MSLKGQMCPFSVFAACTTIDAQGHKCPCRDKCMCCSMWAAYTYLFPCYSTTGIEHIKCKYENRKPGKVQFINFTNPRPDYTTFPSDNANNIKVCIIRIV